MAVTVQFTFASYSILTQLALHNSPVAPLAYALYRDVLATCVLFLAAYITSPNWRISRPEPWQWVWLILSGLLGCWGAQGMSALALQHVDAVLYAALQPAIPVIAFAISLLLGVEKLSYSLPSAGKLTALVVVVGSGVATILFAHEDAPSASPPKTPNFPLGVTAAIINVVAAATYLIVQGHIQGPRPASAVLPPPGTVRLRSVEVTAYSYAAGVVFIACSAITSTSNASDWDAFQPVTLGAIAFAAVFTSAMCYVS